jgi:hypothetical protein
MNKTSKNKQGALQKTLRILRAPSKLSPLEIKQYIAVCKECIPSTKARWQ